MICYFIGLFFMTIMGAFASFFLKKTSNSTSLKLLLFNVYLYIGGLLYFASSLINIWLLRKMEYSVVLTLTSLTYVWTMIISFYLLKEKISKQKIIGVCMILCGVILIFLA